MNDYPQFVFFMRIIILLFLRIFPTYTELLSDNLANFFDNLFVGRSADEVDVFQYVLRIGGGEQRGCDSLIAKAVLHCEFFDRITN